MKTYFVKPSRVLLALLLVIAGASSCAGGALKEGKKVPPLSPQEIHFNAITIDTHNDSLLNVVNGFWMPQTDIGKGNFRSQLDLPKMKQGGLDVAFFGAWTDDHTKKDRANSRILCLLNALYWVAERNTDTFGIARTPAEMEALVREGKLAGVPAVEGGYAFKSYNALELLKQYHDLGVAYISLCWSTSNDLGEGVYEYYINKAVSSGGLTPLGAEVVKEMNRLGMAVDVSHLNDRTFWDLVNVAKAPLIASHSNAWGLYQAARNLKDEQMIAIAKSGGVVHQNFYSGYLGPPGRQTIKELVDHIDYTVKLIGIDHVGLGSDFDGGSMPQDLPNASFYYKITEELVNRSYSREDIEKILGKNTLRVIRAIQDLAEAPFTGGEPVSITADFPMGAMFDNNEPLLKATVKGREIDVKSFRVIVDGIVHAPEYNAGTGLLSLQLKEPLQEKFHIVSFTGSNTSGQVTRETKIFCIKDE